MLYVQKCRITKLMYVQSAYIRGKKRCIFFDTTCVRGNVIRPEYWKFDAQHRAIVKSQLLWNSQRESDLE